MEGWTKTLAGIAGWVLVIAGVAGFGWLVFVLLTAIQTGNDFEAVCEYKGGVSEYPYCIKGDRVIMEAE